jgi:ABC-2 type transport system ATP-binding protein
MIKVTNLTRYYGAFAALRDVSFEVRQGEIIGLLGLNGAGKSTTMQVLAGVLAPTRGTVTFDGVDVTENAEALKANIGFLPEEPPLYRDMSVSAFLLHCARLKGMSPRAAADRLPGVLRTVGLQGREHQVIDTLSLGFKKRVGIAMAVIHDPKLVILDEPISGLDPQQIREMRDVIRKLGQGRAVLISSHILGEISKTCDRLIVLDKGQVVASGTEDQLTAGLGKDRIVLTVRGDQATFLAWLQDHPRVVASIPQEIPGPGLAKIEVKLDDDVRESFLPEVAGAGFGLRLVEQAQELEEAFLQHVRGGAA